MFLDRKAIDFWCRKFNTEDHEVHRVEIPPEVTADFLAEQIPYFDCPDADLTEIYYFRWWSFRKHIRTTPFGRIIIEFMPDVPWAGAFNSISCPAEHHLREARWMHDTSLAESYLDFWLNPDSKADARSYSFGIASAMEHVVNVTGHQDFILGHYEDLAANTRELMKKHVRDCGMYFQNDGRDGMECSIGGHGFRATINSLMYREFQILGQLARKLDKVQEALEWESLAADIRKKILNNLWNEDYQFFMTRHEEDFQFNNVRELHGYTPWYCLDKLDAKYDIAWRQLYDVNGFAAPFGPTTAERRHPQFSLSMEGHECKWDGPSWPFSTAVTLTALANLLHDHDSQSVSRRDWFETFSGYVRSHRLHLPDGTIIPWIDENLHPFTGIWLAREIMLTHPKLHRYPERGKDYAHSTFMDLVISGLCGLRPEHESLTVDPMLPPECWEYFLMDRIPFRGHELAIQYDRDGSHYQRGAGLALYINGKEAARRATLGPLTV